MHDASHHWTLQQHLPSPADDQPVACATELLLQRPDHWLLSFLPASCHTLALALALALAIAVALALVSALAVMMERCCCQSPWTAFSLLEKVGFGYLF
jgi:ABC-type nitrate/sulfonate/bicarbonate transport system permease component